MKPLAFVSVLTLVLLTALHLTDFLDRGELEIGSVTRDRTPLIRVVASPVEDIAVGAGEADEDPVRRRSAVLGIDRRTMTEPASLVLLGFGLTGLAITLRRRS